MELHLHLDGSLSPDFIAKRAAARGVEMPAPPDRSVQSKYFWIFGFLVGLEQAFLDFQAPRLADAAEGGEAEEGWQQSSQGRKLAGF